MKKILFLLTIATCTLASCTTSKSVYNTESDIVAYTLKNKKELMHQKIAQQKSKTILATP